MNYYDFVLNRKTNMFKAGMDEDLSEADIRIKQFFLKDPDVQKFVERGIMEPEIEPEIEEYRGFEIFRRSGNTVLVWAVRYYTGTDPWLESKCPSFRTKEEVKKFIDRLLYDNYSIAMRLKGVKE